MTSSDHRGTGFVRPVIGGLVAAFAIVVLLWVVTGQRGDIGSLKESDAEKDAAIDALTRQVNSLCEDRPKCEPVIDPDSVDSDDPELQDLEIQEVEVQEPERQEAERQEGERDDPDPDDPESQDPDSDDPESQNPESQDAETDDPEFDDPETDDPEIQDPEQQDPEIDDPDPDDPDPNDKPGYPDSFTFTFLGTTYVCTDPDGDHAYSCDPA